MTDADGHHTPIDIARLLAGEVLPAAAETHAHTCERCRRALDEARAASEHFRTAILPRTLDQVRERTEGRSAWWRLRATPWTLAAASAALVAIFAAVIPSPTEDPPGRSGIELTAKGDAVFRTVVRRPDGASVVQDGQHLAAGDQIRFLVQPGDLPFLLVVSVDGAGRASVYYPFAGSRSGRVNINAANELPGSVVLDDTAGPERIFALFSREEISADRVTAELVRLGRAGHAAIRATARLTTSADAQSSLLIEKGPRP